MNVLGVIVPIFGIILFGWFLRRLSLLNARFVDLINDYVYYVGIPVITFISLHDTSSTLLLNPEIYLLNLVPMAIVAIVAYLAARALKLKRDLLAVFVVCAFFGNTGYIGFPLNVAVQGREALNTAAFISTLYTIVTFTFGVYLLRRASPEPVEAGKIHKLPIIWAALLGILLSWAVLPGIVRIPLDLISDSVSPLALLATGAMASGASFGKEFKSIGVLSAIKLVLAPALVILTGLLAGSGGMVYRTSLLEAATPVAVTNAVLAAQFKLKQDFASRAVIASTALFAVTLAVILLLI